MADASTHASPRKKRGELRRELIATAVELISEQGAESWSLREAARRAGVSPGAPFRHFRDKAELLSAVVEHAKEELDRRVDLATRAAEASPIEQFRAQGHAVLRFAIEKPELFRVLHNRELAKQADLQRARRATREATSRMLRDAQHAGLIAEGDPEAQLLAGRALSHGLARMVVDGHFDGLGYSEDEIRELGDKALDVLGLGLLPRKV